MTAQPEGREPQGNTRAGRTTRRDLLAGAAGGAGGLLVGGAAGFGIAEALDEDEAPEALEPTDGYPSGKDPANFTEHGESPLRIETNRALLSTGLITAAPFMFVRQRLPLPDASILDDRDGWSVAVDGVANPRELTVAELKRIGVTTIGIVIQCSGNGRGYFEHDPSGSPWEVGASANVLWTGVPLAALADELGGPAGQARFITGTGGDPIPEGSEEREAIVERSVPIEKLEDCLLAWEMNGEPTPLAHGGPLRLIVPGYYGINNVKFLRRLAFTAEESDADVQQFSYRVYPIGEDPDPEEHPSMWEMNLKSFITSPSGEESVEAGEVRVFGVAFGGGTPVESVEVSVDGGSTWEDASFYGPELGPYAWHTFTHTFDADPGEYLIASRATDADGQTQPEERQENQRGYLHNAWRDPAVRLEVT